jgi:hypothetical protein
MALGGYGKAPILDSRPKPGRNLTRSPADKLSSMQVGVFVNMADADHHIRAKSRVRCRGIIGYKFHRRHAPGLLATVVCQASLPESSVRESSVRESSVRESSGGIGDPDRVPRANGRRT